MADRATIQEDLLAKIYDVERLHKRNPISKRDSNETYRHKMRGVWINLRHGQSVWSFELLPRVYFLHVSFGDNPNSSPNIPSFAPPCYSSLHHWRRGIYVPPARTNEVNQSEMISLEWFMRWTLAFPEQDSTPLIYGVNAPMISWTQMESDRSADPQCVSGRLLNGAMGSRICAKLTKESFRWLNETHSIFRLVLGGGDICQCPRQSEDQQIEEGGMPRALECRSENSCRHVHFSGILIAVFILMDFYQKWPPQYGIAFAHLPSQTVWKPGRFGLPVELPVCPCNWKNYLAWAHTD